MHHLFASHFFELCIEREVISFRFKFFLPPPYLMHSIFPYLFKLSCENPFLANDNRDMVLLIIDLNTSPRDLRPDSIATINREELIFSAVKYSYIAL